MIISKTEIRQIASDYLKKTFGEHDNLHKFCIKEPKFSRWIELCQDRLTQLDSEHYLRSKYAVDYFIKHAVSAFADRQLESEGKRIDANDLQRSQ